MARSRRQPGRGAIRRNERRLAEAVQRHRAGDLAGAAQAYDVILRSDPEQVQALNFLAMIRLGQGAATEAVDLLRRASEAPGADASVWNSLGSALASSGAREEAMTAYRRCLELDPRHGNGRFNLGVALLEHGDAATAAEVLEPMTGFAPGDASVWEAYASALGRAGRHEAALSAWRQAETLAPGSIGVALGLIGALIATHALEAASQRLDALVEATPDSPQLSAHLGPLLLLLGRYGAAAEHLVRALAADGTRGDLRVALVQALTEAGNGKRALAVAEQGLRAHPEDDELRLALGIALLRDNQVDAAAAELEPVAARHPEWVEPQSNLAVAYTSLGRLEEAVERLRAALALAPDSPEAWYNLARSGTPLESSDLASLESMLAAGGYAPEQAATLHFAVAQAYHRAGRHDDAFDQYRRGNALRARMRPFDAAGHAAWTASILEAYDEAFFRRLEDAGVADARPVFILGMPRSGTSLVEQILASHPQVRGGGELPYISELVTTLTGDDPSRLPAAMANLDAAALRDLARRYLSQTEPLGGSEGLRITDKAPLNFRHLGLIAVLFPRADIVHLERDPLDVCFSNFVTDFTAGHHYATDLDSLAVFYNDYRRVMAHWQQRLPGRIVPLRYEALIADQEAESRALVERVGLPWDEACLRFYETRRTVATASDWQVRQPIFHTSTARWRHYRPHLEGLARAIGYDLPRDG